MDEDMRREILSLLDEFCRFDCDLRTECNTRIDCPYRASDEALAEWAAECVDAYR